jgi:hypothetical protein
VSPAGATGIPLGQYYVGPYEERPLVQDQRSIAYTRKDFRALWDYEHRPTET